jgi:hypothetical protein
MWQVKSAKIPLVLGMELVVHVLKLIVAKLRLNLIKFYSRLSLTKYNINTIQYIIKIKTLIRPDWQLVRTTITNEQYENLSNHTISDSSGHKVPGRNQKETHSHFLHQQRRRFRGCLGFEGYEVSRF